MLYFTKCVVKIQRCFATAVCNRASPVHLSVFVAAFGLESGTQVPIHAFILGTCYHHKIKWLQNGSAVHILGTLFLATRLNRLLSLTFVLCWFLGGFLRLPRQWGTSLLAWPPCSVPAVSSGILAGLTCDLHFACLAAGYPINFLFPCCHIKFLYHKELGCLPQSGRSRTH